MSKFRPGQFVWTTAAGPDLGPGAPGTIAEDRCDGTYLVRMDDTPDKETHYREGDLKGE